MVVFSKPESILGCKITQAEPSERSREPVQESTDAFLSKRSMVLTPLFAERYKTPAGVIAFNPDGHCVHWAGVYRFAFIGKGVMDMVKTFLLSFASGITPEAMRIAKAAVLVNREEACWGDVQVVLGLTCPRQIKMANALYHHMDRKSMW